MHATETSGRQLAAAIPIMEPAVMQINYIKMQVKSLPVGTMMERETVMMQLPLQPTRIVKIVKKSARSKAKFQMIKHVGT